MLIVHLAVITGSHHWQSYRKWLYHNVTQNYNVLSTSNYSRQNYIYPRNNDIPFNNTLSWIHIPCIHSLFHSPYGITGVLQLWGGNHGVAGGVKIRVPPSLYQGKRPRAAWCTQPALPCMRHWWGPLRHVPCTPKLLLQRVCGHQHSA